MLKLMLISPPAAAWSALRAGILDRIDDLSGWSRSFQNELGERDQIWREVDVNYYGKDSDGMIYRVIGAKTLEEARPAGSDRPAVDAGLARSVGAERFEKELLVERLLDVRAALKRQEKKQK